MKYLAMIGNFIKTHIVITVVITATVSGLVAAPVIINNIKSEQEKINITEENNTENKTENKQEDIYDKYGDLTKLSNETFDLDENIEVAIMYYNLTPFKTTGECANVVDTYGSLGQYGGSGIKCATDILSQEALDYLNNTPFVKNNGFDNSYDDYTYINVSFLGFGDRFRTEYVRPECYWDTSIPNLVKITKAIHAYNILDNRFGTYSGFIKSDETILNEDICKEYKLTCYRGEEQGKEITELRTKMIDEKLKKEEQKDQAVLDEMAAGTKKYLEDELKKEQDLINKGYVVNEDMTKVNCPHNGCKSYCLNWGDPNDPTSEIGSTCMTVYYTTNPDEE